MICKMLVAAVVVAVSVAAGTQAHAGTQIYLGSQDAAREPVSMDAIDHSLWDAILREYVDDNGMVAYRELHASVASVGSLDRYLQSLSAASQQLPASSDGKLAFWINAYNAVTVRGILREYPTSSIRNHTALLFGYNIWKDLQLYVGGAPYSLEQIEHEILRKMDDPRIHFAIVCASMGCPRLLNAAYLAGRVQQQLEANSRDFFTRSQNFVFDQSKNSFFLSSILSWFGEDFGNNQKELFRSISRWLPSEAARQAALQGTVSVVFLDYNWNLNEQKTKDTADR